ncbi:hypothetical protein Glove_465g31 [Diversispora epigaea]|uniref:Uncharacterized protein n=1 Tax=Diversispora epigaea TaxID=1348612 RepID=A0A397GSR6_9GLOM|nr:hypothetical protein Glove_465g31 [Diversispora epigaea]
MSNDLLSVHYLHNPDVWYIVDAAEPEDVEAKTILFCSPRKDYYRNFDKYIGTSIRYMPIWSLEEIETYRKTIFNHLKSEKVDDLFSKWGGIPRFVLEKSQDISQQQLLEEAITKNSNPRLFDYLNLLEKLITLKTLVTGSSISIQIFQIQKMTRTKSISKPIMLKNLYDLHLNMWLKE